MISNSAIVNESLKRLNQCSTEYIFRTLECDDYHKGYFDLLAQLTEAPKPTYEEFEKRYKKIQEKSGLTIFVVESTSDNTVIGTITCSIEYKFIRNMGSICHIEDFVIAEDHRKKRIGSKLMMIAKEYCEKTGCYKILLDCKDTLVPIYEKMGFTRKSNGMSIYFI